MLIFSFYRQATSKNRFSIFFASIVNYLVSGYWEVLMVLLKKQNNNNNINKAKQKNPGKTSLTVKSAIVKQNKNTFLEVRKYIPYHP